MRDLTTEDKDVIVAWNRHLGISQIALADAFQVSRTTIQRVLATHTISTRNSEENQASAHPEKECAGNNEIFLVVGTLALFLMLTLIFWVLT